MALKKRISQLGAGLVLGAGLLVGTAGCIEEHAQFNIGPRHGHNVEISEKNLEVDLNCGHVKGVYNIFSKDGRAKLINRYYGCLRHEMDSNYSNSDIEIFGRDYHKLPPQVQRQVKPYLDGFLYQTVDCLKEANMNVPKVEGNLERWGNKMEKWGDNLESCVEGNQASFLENVEPMIKDLPKR